MKPAWLMLVAASLAVAGCRRASDAPREAPDAAAPVGERPVPAASAPAKPAAEPPAPPPATPSACPPEMALVGKKFCIDRWESITLDADGEVHSPYHNVGNKPVVAASRAGVVPQGYIAMTQADQACKRANKRLCTTQQWVDACMGVDKPKRDYPYGQRADAGACNTSRRLHPRFRLKGDQRDDVMALNDPQLNQLNETVAKTGEFERCATPDGVFDLHGNLLEWTRGPQPLLMGGHYLDGKRHGVGCTYVTDGHGSEYHDFTTGFRCCKPADPKGILDAPEPPQPASAGDDSRDPPGMRGFANATGKLPKLEPPPYEPPDAACPVDMVHVSGLRCSEPEQFCKEWLPRKSAGTKIACKEFKQPSSCESSRRNMSYCIDRYEFQPQGYDFPLTHVSWGEAQNLCRAMDKRLCMEDEWEFACEGPDALPYPYGFVRDGKKCNHDFPEEQLVSSPDVFIDRRVAKDALPECKSPFGVFNLVGNVDEWTTRYNASPGRRGILRGGWWLIGRNRCRAATANHGERYAGMQTGFRCCKAARR